MRSGLIKARRSLGLSQYDVAQLVGCAQNTISAYEAGRGWRVDAVSQLATICDALRDLAVERGLKAADYDRAILAPDIFGGTE